MKVMECEFNSNGSCVELYEYEKKRENNETKVINKVKLFIFELRREKSNTTDFEQLLFDVAQVSNNKKVCSNIVIKPYAILEGLLELKKYGLILHRSVYTDISNVIEANYLNLKIDSKDSMSSELTKQKVSEIFEMFCEYIKDFKIKLSENSKGIKSYNIPVNDFLKYLKDSDYMDFDTTKIRNGLRDEEFTVCSTSRNDNTVVDTETKKAFKAISFKFDKVEKINNR